MLANLPEWNLADLYSSKNAPEITDDLATIEKLSKDFKANYQGQVQKLNAKTLAKAIADYEHLSDLAGRIGSYAQLLYAKKATDPEIAVFYQTIQEKLTDYGSHTLFFTLALNKIDEKNLEAMMASSPELKHYQPWLRDLRAMRPYQLDDKLEKLLHEKYVAGRGAWVRLFDETIANLRFGVDGKKLSSAEVFDLMSNKDEATRKKAAQAIGKVLKQNASLFALITNTLAKDKEIEDKWRGFKKPITSRNVSNLIEDEVVDALVGAVRASYPSLSHRYYRMKANWLGKERLEFWDRNAPLPQDNDKLYSWEEAQEIVLSAYRQFSPRLAEVGAQFFAKGWIDAPVTPGKSPGAFAHPTVPSAHPYLLVNFQGKTRDVMTLAHELGHGVHQCLSGKQGALMADTPLTLAETASVFGEQLTFREMLRRETNAESRRIMLASKVEDMLNTVVRQIAFCDFERQVHRERRKGELTVERLNKIWIKVQRESLGSGLKLGGNYKFFWSYIPHFVHSPFYVYAYAFGDCLVNSLYAGYQKATAEGKAAEFEQKYIAMLEAGGTLRHQQLLAPFGLDATDPNFWQQGLAVISSFIDELEKTSH